MIKQVSIFWFRRDLRIQDNHGLFQALSTSAVPVLPIFIFDPTILSLLPSKKDGRVEFIHQALSQLKKEIKARSGDIKIYFQDPQQVFEQLSLEFNIQAVYTNHDYELYGFQRDLAIAKKLEIQSIPFLTFKDQVIFEKNEVLSGQGTPYTVFTPYSRKWKERLANFPVIQYDSASLTNYIQDNFDFPSLNSIGFENTNLIFPSDLVENEVLLQYSQNRDFPSKIGTSRLSIHLRFGTISIRSLVEKALKFPETWLNELIWRDFYFNILFHFPHVSQGHAFRKEYDRMNWINNETEFEAWKQGLTGYPLVDAGMRELNQTGFMHNRVRMVTASFLVKHLLIDWRWGQAYFAEKLLDYDFSANNGGWQWAAGCGCDAAPYFRVFNPTLQAQKFDSDLKYMKHWIPELQELTYPTPIVHHEFARNRAIDAYKLALNR